MDMQVCTESDGQCELAFRVLDDSRLPIRACDWLQGYAAYNPGMPTYLIYALALHMDNSM